MKIDRAIAPLPVSSVNAEAVGYVCTSPEEGLAQLEVLKSLGCKPHHRVLEIGCGALVAGYPIMQYLNDSNYWGVDPNYWLRTASLSLPEVSAVALSKRAWFIDRSDFRTEDGKRFDFILSHSILSHTSDTQLTEFLDAAADQLAEGGTLAASIRFAEGNEFGSSGSREHGAAFTEWQYPGVSWFRQVDVVERALESGLLARSAPELTQIITRANPKAVHDWIIVRRDGPLYAKPVPQPKPKLSKPAVTLVTAFFRLEDRKVDEDAQFRLFFELAKCGLPIILFFDGRLNDNNELSGRIPENVRAIPSDLGKLWAFERADGRSVPAGATPSKDTRDFLKLQNSKLDLLNRASQLDNESTHFAWIDFGVLKVVRDHEAFRRRLRSLKPPASCVLAPGCWDAAQSDAAPHAAFVNWRFCGGFLLADRDSIPPLVEKHHEVFSASPTLTWEVNVWAEMERNGQKFDWYKADHDDTLIGAPAPTGPRICLNMIVCNESKIIERCLTAALPFIDTWAIVVDTASTDDTAEKIERFFNGRGIPGVLLRSTFIDFAQQRNFALEAARSANGTGVQWDYALLIDADMVIEGTLDRKTLTAPAYNLRQSNIALDYPNTRLVRRNARAIYVGVTHEFLSVEGVTNLVGLIIDDRDDGGSKSNKGERDIRLLNDGLAKEPKNERYMYYLANTYREMDRPHKALHWYQKRIDAGGWDQEIWSSYYGIARCLLDLGDKEGFVKACLDAYNYRPTRGESLKLLAKFYRESGQNESALLIAEALSKIKNPGTELFVERDVYDCGADQEIAIAGFYGKSTERREAGYRACAALTVHRLEHIRKEARTNFTHYAKSAKDLFGAEVRAIDWKPDDGYKPMNPSVCIDSNGRRLILVRTVNYTVTREGQYPTLDNSGIIRTRNWMVEFDQNWKALRSTRLEDDSDRARTKFPVEGFEDCRLWRHNGRFYASATVRDLSEDGRCEMAVLSLSDGNLDDRWRVTDVDVIRDYHHDLPQKNWMPIVGLGQRFLYLCDPTVTVARMAAGGTEELSRSTPPACLVDLRGGSQLIEHGDGWLCLTHEVAWRPERVYMHRFVKFDQEFRVVAISDPFYFESVGIEFCAGLARDGNTLVASFGVNDASAHLAMFAPDRIDTMLRAPLEYKSAMDAAR